MTYVQSFNDVTPPARFDGNPWEDVLIEESATEAGTFTEIDDQPITPDPTPETPVAIDLTTSDATLAAGWYRFRFRDGAGNLSPYSAAVRAPNTPAFAFATIADLEARLGRALTEPEIDQATLLLEVATGLIIEVGNRDAAWGLALDPVPARFRSICIESALRVLLNPSGARSSQETLGQYSHSETFAGDVGTLGLAFTDREERHIRRIANGRSSGSFHAKGAVDTVREINDDTYDETT